MWKKLKERIENYLWKKIIQGQGIEYVITGRDIQKMAEYIVRLFREELKGKL